MTTHTDPGDRFEELLRAWGSRAPATDPARATRRVLAALPPRRREHPFLQLAAVATVLVAVLVTVFLSSPTPTVHPTRTAQADAPAHVDERVVQFWIDPSTPVYFVLSPLGSEPGGTT